MNIMISINRSYIPYACVMLMSLKERHKGTELSVYILHSELTEEDFLAMDEVIGPEDISLIPVFIPMGTVKDFQIGEWPEEAAYRLLATDLFAGSMDRILHLDVDILITGDILGFYNTPFDGNYLAVCEDSLTDDVRRRKYRELGKDADTLYFNSGALLFNLSKLAEDGFYYSVYADILKKYSAIKIEYPDQDMLNLLFSRKTKYMDRLRYNYVPYFYKTCDPAHYYSTREELEKNCSIVHMASGTKPWESTVRTGAAELWWEYAERTPYYYAMKAHHVQSMLHKERKLNDAIRGKIERIAAAQESGKAGNRDDAGALLDEISRREQALTQRIEKNKKN